MLADPKDDAVRAQVAALLARLASDPDNGIERIWSHEEIVADRGFPDAAFLVAFKTGYEIAYAFTPPLISAPADLGMHGYPPENPEMRSSFFLVGPNVPVGRSLGGIDMRRIAPTLAHILHAPLTAAELPPLDLR
jgi:predicted AlkP superfamily pyrophosphatase or phosphodiesterase